ncbi:thioredoxin domain-containing protein [Halorubrum sp. JWXQ-INN 858]|uniref:thioredoxin domain-containing protein n=1 Tax=Halorubrum sp. JWXQ-INN 858 TaxID=2690782 RepID=UPI001357D9D6|nr:thioredoxin domain-containing protein [Halorubrum sp. JWXQ-INN 858]MWV64944.1 thioredoxin domain-containing protein [Halorubrum sp. JWXQ-INN 858]
MEHTRRAVLAGVGAVGVVGAAGCLGDDAPDTPDYDCDRDEPEPPDTDFRPVLGDPDSDVLVQTFEDFTCGGCATFKAEEFPTIREAHVDTGEVRYEHWDFPIPVDEDWAVPVASAARGVGAREGDEAFFEFASAVYEFHGSYSHDAIGAAAEAAGADPCAAIADAEFVPYEGPILADREEGVARGLESTPTVYVNGDPVDGASADAVAAAIADAQS